MKGFREGGSGVRERAKRGELEDRKRGDLELLASDRLIRPVLLDDDEEEASIRDSRLLSIGWLLAILFSSPADILMDNESDKDATDVNPVDVSNR